MTSEPRRGFPLVLTLAAAAAFAVCVALGVWQLQRAAWKSEQLARLQALRTAAPQPVAPLLTGAGDHSFARVVAVCASAPPAAARVRMVTDHGDWIARALADCRFAAGPYDGVVVDRGFIVASRGAPDPPPTTLPSPLAVTGVLAPERPPAGTSLRRPAAYVLYAERETPQPPGLAPAPPADVAQNLRYVGAYAPTWFGLAAVVAGVYAAMLWRRRRPKA
jgi:surfeit locus 1 family protein